MLELDRGSNPGAEPSRTGRDGDGHQKNDEQEQLFVTHANLGMSGGHLFYEALEKIFKAQGFDRYVEHWNSPELVDTGQRAWER